MRPSDPDRTAAGPDLTGPGEPRPTPPPPASEAPKPAAAADRKPPAGTPPDSGKPRDDAGEPMAAASPGGEKPVPGKSPTEPRTAPPPTTPGRAPATATAPKSPPPAPPPPASGGGYGAGIFGGVVGGIVGAVLVGVGLPWLQGPPPLSPAAAERVATLESGMARLDEQLSSTGAQLAAADAELAGLNELSSNLESTVESAVAAAVERIPSRDAAAIAAVGDRLDEVSAKVDQLAAAAAAAVDPAPLLDAQAQRLEALQAALTSLDNRLASEAQRLDAARAEATRTLQASIDGTAAKIEAAGKTAKDDLEAARAALSDRIDKIDANVETVRSSLASLETSVSDLQLARNRAAAAALLTRDIDRSIETGAPFADALARLTAMGTGDSELEQTLTALEPMAASGVPTIAELRQGLVELDKGRQPAPVAGSEWLGRTVGNITGLVEVRERDNESAAATGLLGEAETALRQGDLDTAIARVEKAKTMPDGPDADAADAWLARAHERAAAKAALTQLDGRIRDLLTATVN